MKSTCLLHLAILLIVHAVSAGTVHVGGVIRNAGEESLQCTIVSGSLHAEHVQVVLPVQNGRFYHRFELSEATFLSFGDGDNYFGGYVEPGDSIFIQYDRLDFGNSISYRGTGKEKFEIAYLINQIKGFPRKFTAASKSRRFPVDYMFLAIDSLKNAVNARIDLCADSMGRESSMQLRGYLAATELLARYNALVAIFGDSYNSILTNHRDKLSGTSVAQIRELLRFDEAYCHSRFYIDAVKAISSIYLEENIQPEMNDFADRKYRVLAGILPEKLRSPVIYMTLVSDIATPASDLREPAVRDAIDQLTDSRLKQRIMDMLAKRNVLKVGDKAPEFSVQNLSGKRVNLSSFRGKTIYLDFWFASCGPCHSLFKSIEPVKRQFENDDRVVFLTVSVDNRETWKKAIGKFGVEGYHVFTENKLRQHPIIKSYNVTSYPATFMIDPAGRFYSLRPSNNPDTLRKQIEETLRVAVNAQ